MITLITNAEIFAPHAIGRGDLLIADGRIAAIDTRIDIQGSDVHRLDAGGCWLVPGFVDALTHPAGGGGEGGFGNRTDELSAMDFFSSGVTTAVAGLGTDSIARTLEVVYGKVMSLRAAGLAAYMYTGSYRVPAPTLTGDIARDLVLIEPVIGLGEIAISDHRSAQPTIEELRRVAADTRLGGILSGKGGAIFVHVGDGESGLGPLRAALSGTELPAGSFYPTHVNRNTALLNEAADFAKSGNYVDITASTTPELIAAGDIPALEALQILLAADAPANKLTISSDAGGSLPVYEAGQLTGLTSAMPDSLLETLQQCIRDHSALLPELLAALTLNPANALGLTNKGRLEVGADADLLLLDADSGELSDTFCLGQCRFSNTP